MRLKNIFKSIKNRFHTQLQRKYLAYQTELKHLRELQAIHSLHPTKQLTLEIQQLDKTVIQLNMEYIKFYEAKRNAALSGFQRELNRVTPKED